MCAARTTTSSCARNSLVPSRSLTISTSYAAALLPFPEAAVPFLAASSKTTRRTSRHSKISPWRCLSVGGPIALARHMSRTPPVSTDGRAQARTRPACRRGRTGRGDTCPVLAGPGGLRRRHVPAPRSVEDARRAAAASLGSARRERPIITGKGSGIFLHRLRVASRRVAGCVRARRRGRHVELPGAAAGSRRRKYLRVTCLAAIGSRTRVGTGELLRILWASSVRWVETCCALRRTRRRIGHYRTRCVCHYS